MLSFLGLGGSKDSGKALGYNKGKRVAPPAADTDDESSSSAYAPAQPSPSPESAIGGGPGDTSINDGNDSHSSPPQQGLHGQEQGLHGQEQEQEVNAFNIQQLQSGLVLEEDSLAGGTVGGTSRYSSLARRQEELGEGETEPGTARSYTSTISGTTVTTAATNGGRKKKRKKKGGDTASVAAGTRVVVGVGDSAFPAISEEGETEVDLELSGPQLKGMTMSERCKALDIWRLRGT